MSSSFESQYQEFIFQRTYARWLPDKGRRETWEETVDRYMTFFESRVPVELQTEFQDAILAIYHMQVMPSMRALWTAGPALAVDNLAGFNCLAGDTEVLTKEHGLGPIADRVGPATVLNRNNEWVPAQIMQFGNQQTVEVVVAHNRHLRTVRATLDHDWVLTSWDRVKTRDLKPGMRLPCKCHHRKIHYDSIDYQLGLAHGLIYGDGTRARLYNQERVKGYHIRLCADQEDLLPILEAVGGRVCYPPSANGDPVVMLYGPFAKTHSLKDLPVPDETEDYLVGFFRGWFAADGCISGSESSPQCSIAVGQEEEEWLRRLGPTVGYEFQSSYEFSRQTNFGRRKKRLWKLTVARWSLTPEDFIIGRKRERFRPLSFDYVVHSVKLDSARVEPVYCAVVPSTHDFTLGGGLLTGNCSYTPISDLRSFAEILYILMCGTGVGFSVEEQYVSRLPEAPSKLVPSDRKIVFVDSKRGWAEGFLKWLRALFAGEVARYDLSRIRPAGTPLKTFGGRASGPGPLKNLLDYATDLMTRAAGRKLTGLECHDLACVVANCVVVGGVRRSACISLTDLKDMEMAKCKAGHNFPGIRHRANISAVYAGRPNVLHFLDEWYNLIINGSGERGIFNRQAAMFAAAVSGRRDKDYDFGTNPCGEVILRPYGLCNLSEIVIREKDKPEDLVEKARLATVLGMLQSTCTKFQFVRREWKQNAEEERLLGVSLTGLMDHPVLNHVSQEARELLFKMKCEVLETARRWSAALGINVPAATTCVKPSGTVSQLVNSASGIHPRFSQYYIRRVEVDRMDPLAKMMLARGVPNSIRQGSSGILFEFPVASPEACKTTGSLNALQQLEFWLMLKRYWCEHNPSCTIYIKPDEWIKVAAWVYEHWDSVCGLTFFPKDGGVYENPPYEEIDEETYLALRDAFPVLDFSELSQFEKQDETLGAKEFACAGGACEL